jgi:hypothetical protein
MSRHLDAIIERKEITCFRDLVDIVADWQYPAHSKYNTQFKFITFYLSIYFYYRVCVYICLGEDIYMYLLSYDRDPTTKIVHQIDMTGLRWVYSFRRQSGDTFMVSTSFDDNIAYYVKMDLPTKVGEEKYDVRYAPKSKEEVQEEKAEKEREKKKNAGKSSDPLFGAVQLNFLLKQKGMRELVEQSAKNIVDGRAKTTAEAVESQLKIDRKGVVQNDLEEDESEIENGDDGEEEQDDEDDEDVLELINQSQIGKERKFDPSSFLSGLLTRSTFGDEVKVRTRRQQSHVNTAKYKDSFMGL